MTHVCLLEWNKQEINVTRGKAYARIPCFYKQSSAIAHKKGCLLNIKFKMDAAVCRVRSMPNGTENANKATGGELDSIPNQVHKNFRDKYISAKLNGGNKLGSRSCNLTLTDPCVVGEYPC